MELVKINKNFKVIKKIFFALLGSILLAISAKINIPFYPVPMTMQTFVVLLIGVSFGWKLGGATVLLYLGEGLLGIPVFAGTPEKGIGLVYFTGPTMGYLLGFIITVFLAGSFNYSKNFLTNFVKLTISISFIYILGMLWLGTLIGWNKPIFELGAQPFMLAELFKILLATAVVSKISKFKNLI